MDTDQREGAMPAEGAMTAEEWFTKREGLASAFVVEAKAVPAEAVWFLSLDQPFSDIEMARARSIHATIEATH